MSARKFRCGWQSFQRSLGLVTIGVLLTGCSGEGPFEIMERRAAGEFTVVPRTTTIHPGGIVQLTIQGSDANAGKLAWSARPPAVAEVDESGRVLGRGTGDAVVTVTNGRLVDSAWVRVEGSAAGPAGAPEGYRLLADHPFHELNSSPWTVAWNDRNYLRVVDDASAPRSCCKVAEFFYPRGFEAGHGPASIDLALSGRRGLYVSMWWKASEEWHGHPTGVNKMIFVFGQGGPENWTMVWHGKGALRFAPQHPRGWEWLESNVDQRGLRAGRWYHIEFLLEKQEGEHWAIKWWVDGSLRGAHERVRWSDTRLDNFKVNPTWGGVGGRKSRDDYFRWDHIQVSVSP